MMDFKFFHGYGDEYYIENLDEYVTQTDRREVFERLMGMLHDIDRMAEPNRNNYEVPDDLSEE